MLLPKSSATVRRCCGLGTATIWRQDFAAFTRKLTPTGRRLLPTADRRDAGDLGVVGDFRFVLGVIGVDGE